ncbi:hypothetical protein D9757_002919 [Collybiopsis confluens]|uniref:GH16 domain-containing protein n=1 Tax=Collybiopsis confluens TaxID=2823264 RepID=A0A8H5ME21_9AGAR|nr:hypothetical protein D9757_002919 [Collybiopsis confluens]
MTWRLGMAVVEEGGKHESKRLNLSLVTRRRVLRIVTHLSSGTVNFLNATQAFTEGLAYVQDNGIVIMKGDNSTTLSENVNRNSVRISSNKQYNTGLFILDINQAPWGCGVWPAFWTTGEIDILEGVHDNQHNQVTWHTGPNCSLTPQADFSGTIVQSNGVNNTNCDGNANSNAGCGITEWSRASYGPFFDQQGGGVFAMKWDENGIAVWSFYRAAIPQDIQAGVPNPSNWGIPVAALEPGGCDPISNFINHSIIFDITFCGDWAGNSYATSGCPGTCSQQLMEPSNFDNASWSINTLKVFRKQLITGQITSGASFAHLNIGQHNELRDIHKRIFQTLSSALANTCSPATGSAKLARRGVTLTAPLYNAHPSLPSVNEEWSGRIKPSIDGDHWNTRLLSVDSALLAISSEGIAESGPATSTFAIVVTGGGVQARLNPSSAIGSR